MSDNLHYFSAEEYPVQKKLQKLRDSILGFLVKPLIALRIPPNTVTLASFLCVLAAAYFLVSNPYLGALFLLLHVLLDGIDGVLARATNTASRAGAFLDVLNDHTGFVIITGALVYYGLLNLMLGFIYAYLYSLLVVLLVYSNTLGVPPKFTLRTKYFLYIVYGIWVLWGINLFEPVVVIFIVLTIPFLLGLVGRAFTRLKTP